MSAIIVEFLPRHRWATEHTPRRVPNEHEVVVFPITRHVMTADDLTALKRLFPDEDEAWPLHVFSDTPSQHRAQVRGDDQQDDLARSRAPRGDGHPA